MIRGIQSDKRVSQVNLRGIQGDKRVSRMRKWESRKILVTPDDFDFRTDWFSSTTKLSV